MAEDEKKSTLLGLSINDIADDMLIVFGEDATKVQNRLIRLGYDIENINSSREFHTFNASNKDYSFPLIVAGLGSASVECVLSEIGMKRQERVDQLTAGMKEAEAEKIDNDYKINLYLAGTCGASKDYTLGETVILTMGRINNNGSSWFYQSGRKRLFGPSAGLLKKANEDLGMKVGNIFSSDAFYGFGCILKDNQLEYSGAPLNAEDTKHKGFEKFKELYNSKEPYLIDMETAVFYMLCQRLKGLEGIAIKGVSNFVPFDVDNAITHSNERLALESSIDSCVKLIESSFMGREGARDYDSADRSRNRIY
ncbi:hypothetical protein JXB31_02375 [Candidatus Woesearchaeota archaeon]|nr:hypothetical protein [Candidatus Woesearchaeota archaeon]